VYWSPERKEEKKKEEKKEEEKKAKKQHRQSSVHVAAVTACQRLLRVQSTLQRCRPCSRCIVLRYDFRDLESR